MTRDARMPSVHRLQTGATLPAPSSAGSALRALVQHLLDLYAALKQLGEIADEKLAALRRADTAKLQVCAAREEAVLRTLFGCEQQRKAVLARVAQSLHCPDPARVQLVDVADRLPEPLASSLRARSEALGHIATELRRKNQLAATVAQRLLTHVRGVFAEWAEATQESVGYGPGGQHAVSGARSWVDAVG